MTPSDRKSYVWHRRFLGLAREVATWSKDPHCQVGAILVNDRRIIATGYNGFPAGIEDTYEGISKEEKNARTIHAELNALLNAGERWAHTIYVTKDPCLECCKAIIQAQVREVVLPLPQTASRTWEKSQSYGQLMLCEADVKIVRIDV